MSILGFIIFAIVFFGFIGFIFLLLKAQELFYFRHISLDDILKKIPGYSEADDLKKRQLLVKYLREPYIDNIIKDIKKEKKRKNKKND